MSCQLIPLSHVDTLLAYAALATGAPRNLPLLKLTVPADCTNDGKPLVLDFSDAATRDDIGRLIYGANADALEELYQERHGLATTARALAESYTFKPATGTTEPARILGACDYVDYQCDGPETYAMSLPQWLIAAIRGKAATELRDGWCIDDTDERAADMPEEPESAESEEAPSAPRAALLAKLSDAGAMVAALPDEPTQQALDAAVTAICGPDPRAPKPDLPTDADKARKAAAKPKAKAKGKARRKVPAKAPRTGEKASPPAAGASKRKAAPQTA